MKFLKSVLMLVFGTLVLLLVLGIVTSLNESKKEQSTPIQPDEAVSQNYYGFDSDGNVFFYTKQNAPSWRYDSVQLAGETKETFQIFSHTVAKSNDTVYVSGEPVEVVANPAGFRPVANNLDYIKYFTDDEFVYYLPAPKNKTLIDFPLKLKEGEVPRVPEQLQSSLYEPHEVNFLQVGNSLYLNGRKIPDANPATFKYVGYDMGDVSTYGYPRDRWYVDDSNVYFNGYKVLGANPESFRVPPQSIYPNRASIGVDDTSVYSREVYNQMDLRFETELDEFETIDIRDENLSPNDF